MTASIVLVNGRIYTLERAVPEASAVAISGDRILAVGDDRAMESLLGPGGRVLDLNGRCVVPGLVDAHVHFQSYALGLQQIELAGARNVDEAVSRVAGRVDDPGQGQWLQGRGWNQDEWPGGAFPTAADLDAVAPDRPVYLRHKSGHAVWVNSRAMRLAGIDRATPDPPGGRVQRDVDGEPTGILLEQADQLVSKLLEEPTERQLTAAMRSAQKKCHEAGLTGIHDFDGRRCFQALQSLHGKGELDLRIVKNIRVRYLEHAIGLGLRSGFGDDWLRIGGIKIFADGALGPRTASMIAPYEGEAENLGIVVTDKEEMMAETSRASAHGLALTIHAIGDRANHDVLDVLEAVRREEAGDLAGAPSPRKALRHRIEHVQILHPDDFDRLARLGIIASMQPVHATADMEMAERYWGGRARYSYSWRALLDTGAVLAFGSDAPVEPIEPLPGIHAAVTRRRADGSPGPEGWYPEQRLSIEQAVRAFTLGAAYAGGQEDVVGSISPGKLADLTIFERDIFTMPANELLEAGIAGTMVGGDFKYRAW